MNLLLFAELAASRTVGRSLSRIGESGPQLVDRFFQSPGVLSERVVRVVHARFECVEGLANPLCVLGGKRRRLSREDFKVVSQSLVGVSVRLQEAFVLGGDIGAGFSQFLQDGTNSASGG